MESCAKSYQIYQELWETVIGEEPQCQRERDNPADIYAVAVRKRRTVFGHRPRRLSRHCACLSEEEDPYTPALQENVATQTCVDYRRVRT